MTIICFILSQIAMACGFFVLGMGVCNYLHVSHSGRDEHNVSNNCGCHSEGSVTHRKEKHHERIDHL